MYLNILQTDIKIKVFNIVKIIIIFLFERKLI